MDVVLYFRPTPKAYSKPEKLAGVLDIAQKAHVHVQVIEEPPRSNKTRHLCEFWKAKGAIVECGGRQSEIRPSVFGKLPVVFFNHSLESLPSNCFAVSHNSRQTGELAARELLMSGIGNFAYVPDTTNAFWSREREQGFRNALSLNGRRCATLRWQGRAKNATGRNKFLQSYLKKLPKPCAIFAANDFLAAEVITATRMAGLAVPEEIAVLGVDNSTSVCEHANPTLSSIEPDFRRGGNLAMLMLLAAIHDGNAFRGPRQRTFGDLQIVRRLSTKRLQRADPAVADALDYIRRHACDGLKAAEVARRFPCSRRMVDMRFGKAIGHSILDEIQSVRLERAKGMLLNPNQELKSISDFCGFKNPNSLRKFFRKETGMTLSEWRTESQRSKDQSALDV